MYTFLIALFLFTNPFATSDSILVTSEIKEVTVYRQQAQIQRKAAVNLKAGKNTIVFKKLTSAINQNSIQLTADGQFTVLSITHRYDYFATHQKNPVILELEKHRDSLQQQITLLDSDRNVIQRQMSLLGNISAIINNNELTAAELTQFLDLYRSRATKLEREQIRLNEKITEKQNELNKIRSQLRELDNGQRQRFSEVIAEVSSDKDQTLTFSLSYLVHSAGWVPSYDIRSQSVSEPLSLNYKAKVYQNTGNDWDDVSLTINSGNPSAGATLPSISPTYIDFIQTYPPAANQKMLDEVVVTGYAESGAANRTELPMEAKLPSVDFTQNQTSFSYKINTPYSVPSDGKAHMVEIKRTKVVTDYAYSTIPKYAQHAYLIGKISDWDQLNLIAGEANIYFENSFIGTTQLNPNSFDDTLSVSLGRDEGIIVDRTKLRDFEERNFFGNKVREKYAWEINIRNTKSEPITITIKDQLPVSGNEDIKVNANRLSSGKLNKETGIVTWTLTLAPNHSESLRFDYQIEYPSDQQIRY
ncbi:mucoidy inhibitor MuiA family protein [Gracilimonas sp.]|uniref:mucoidy inhibitor MuiA family protein n=1 Tax=Gracilimonas sp. TaxID=1974203 RepID=UPI003BA915C6